MTPTETALRERLDDALLRDCFEGHQVWPSLQMIRDKLVVALAPRFAPNEDALLALVMEFANLEGICLRSPEWHEAQPCESCQGLVNLCRRAIALEAK